MLEGIEMLDDLKAWFQPAPPLVEYIFVDQQRLVSYAEQLNVTKSADRVPTWNVGLSMKGPSVGGKEETKLRPATVHEMVTKLVRHLKKNDQLQLVRTASKDHQYQFALEQTTARRIVLPMKHTKVVPYLKELAVWVSNPLEEPGPRTENDMHQAKGTFLYLLEGYWNSDEDYHGFVSNWSALNSILNAVSEPMGLKASDLRKYDARDSFQSPLATLKEIGGIPESPRKIQTLYRKRFVSDDQYVMINGVSQRSYDLFAYPIYIAAV
jgi:hypothetical protein